MLHMFAGLGTRVSAKGFAVFALALTALPSASAFAQEHGTVTVTPDEHHDTLPSLRDTPPAPHGGRRVHFEGELPPLPGPRNLPDGAIQRTMSPTVATPAPISTVDGIGNNFTGPNGTFVVNSSPPDTVGAVGPNHYVQVVNADFAVFSKATKAVVFGPVATNTLWHGFGGLCETDDDGDGIVVYDKAADRWVLSQFAVTGADGANTPFLECVAVSQTGDPTGAWNRYAFGYTGFNDYPKMGVWPDGYYTTFNMFNSAGTTYLGAKLCVYDRARMLAGQAATQQCFQTGSTDGGVLPSDMDGANPPPAGSPNYMVELGSTNGSLKLFKFHVDWANTANTTLSAGTSIPVASFAQACGGGTCIPQSGTSQQLDSLADRLMFRLAYRNFGTNESLVVSHSVTAGAGVGARWYEMRNPGAASPSVFQQSTFAPDGNFRWMPSVAMDRQGNMMLGYSVSGSSLYPSIRYTGRLAGDPLSTMQTEASMIVGTGSQSGVQGLTRWGDYSAMTVDPTDDCTFWYTNEYLKATGEFNWSTRIGSFKFPSCGYTIGGSVSGQTSGFTLAVTAASQTVSVASGATNYVFPAGEPTGTSYTVSVQTQPTGQTCTVANPSGTISASNVTNANVTCKTNQTITFPNPGPVTYSAGGTFALNATASSGLAATYTSTTTSVCTVSGPTATIVGAGTCAINADQAGNATHNPAPTVTDNITINKASQTITYTSTPPGSAKVGGATYNVTATGGASGNPVTFTIDATASSVCTISGSAVSFTGAGTCVIDANQAGNANYNAAPQNPQSFAVGPGTPTLVFTVQPTDANQGNALGTIQVTEKDPLGHVISASGTVDFTITACGGTVDLGSVMMTAGVATLTSTQRFYTLAAAPGLTISASNGTLNATSNGFRIVAADMLFSDGFESCRL
ncbi:hypothetical protein [Dokdonella soli]|uniref:Uncharacterized protein n=1 Tax=Dokdonella soli TaxID=529810 RepID=A0ABN1ICQ9_9GAMM